MSIIPEWLKNLLIAIGGGSVVLIGCLTIFKNLFIKLFETGIETSFEKKIEKYRNRLTRSTKAYEMLLDREMQFYSNLESIFSELVMNVREMRDFLKESEFLPYERKCNTYFERLQSYADQSRLFEKELVLHRAYLLDSLISELTILARWIGEGFSFWFEMGQHMSAKEYEKLNYAKGNEFYENIVINVERVELTIKKRLNELSSI